MNFKSILPRALAAIFLASVALGANAQVTRSGSKYLLRMKYVKGQTLRYMAQSGFQTGPKQRTTVNVPMAIYVLGVKGDVSSLQVTVGPVTANGRQVQAAHTGTVQVDSLGRPMGGSSAPMMSGSFPKKAIGIGETWSATVPIEQLGMKVNMKFLFRGLKTVFGRQVALISTAINSLSSGKDLSGHGEMQVLSASGIISSLKLNMTLKVPGAKGQPGNSIAFTTNMTLAQK